MTRLQKIIPAIVNNRLLPHNLEAEKNLIIGCLGDPTCCDRALRFVNAEDFYKRGTRKLFERLCDFRKQGRTYTPSLVIESFRGDPDFEIMENFILAETQNYITGQVAKHYGSIIRDLSIKRKTIQICEDVIERSFDAGYDSRTNLKILINDATRLQKRCKEVDNA